VSADDGVTPAQLVYGQRADRGDGVPRPADIDACTARGCPRTDELRLVEREDGRERVLCPFHEKHFLGVST